MSSRSEETPGRGRRRTSDHRPARHGQLDMPVREPREWLSSYIYGNITVLGAAIAVGPEQIHDGAAVWAVWATGLLTFFAHVLAHVVAHGLGEDDGEPDSAEARRSTVRGVISTARPIATSALIPAALYAAGWLGWLPTGWVQTAAIVVLAVRIGLVGVFMQRFSGKKLTFAALWGGVALALIAFGIGFVKVLLTH